MSFKLIKQHDIKDCGAACLSMICQNFGLKLPIAQFRDLIKVDNHGANIYGIVDGADKVGLCGTALKGSPDELIESIVKREVTLPFIARVIIDGTLEHFVVIYRITSRYIYVADPGKGKYKCSYENFFRIWTGHIITFEKTERFVKENKCKGTLSRFVRLVTVQKKLLASVFLISLFIATIGIVGTFVFQIIIDSIENASTDGFGGYSLSHICIAVIVLYMFQCIIEILRSYFLTLLSKNVDLPLMLGFYNHIQDIPIKHTANRKTGEILSRFSDASGIRNAISGAALSLMLDTFMVVICVIVLLLINKVLFVITLFTVLVYAIVVICFVNPIKSINEKLMEQNADVISYLKESIDGIETVKAFGAQNVVKKITADKYGKYVNIGMRGSMIYAFQESLSGLVSSTGIIVLLWGGTGLVVNNVISLGTLITFYSLLGYFLSPIERLINLQPELQNAVVAAERLNDILDLEVESDEGNEFIFDNSIIVKNVDFRYGNRELVLKNIRMSIKGGETVALVGESGSGKTTLAKLMMSFFEPEKGNIYIGGRDIALIGAKNIRKHIAYISQDVFLFSDTIKNNLTLGNDAITMEEIEEACRLSCADEFIEKMPMGYNTFIGENGYDISGGQKQRLAIARALLKKPKILIMDEATSNLDTITEKSIRDTVKKLGGDITIIVIAHRLSTIKSCDRIYVMKDGEIAESGTHDELIEKDKLYKKYFSNE